MIEDYKEYSQKLENKERCIKCRENETRKKFIAKDFYGQGKYCPFYGIVFNQIINSPIDVLIVTEGHGGGSWKEIDDAENAAKEMYDFYINGNSESGITEDEKEKRRNKYGSPKPYKFDSFHQREIVHLLKKLNNCSWILTDFIHCYVHKKDIKDATGTIVKGVENIEAAAKNCFPYLIEIIKKFNPKNIVLMGNNVQEWYKTNVEPTIEKKPKPIKIAFPSQRAADGWCRYGGAECIIEKLTHS